MPMSSCRLRPEEYARKKLSKRGLAYAFEMVLNVKYVFHFPHTNYTSDNQRLGSAFDDLDPRLSLLCQVGDDVIRPCKICGGCQICVPRSIR